MALIQIFRRPDATRRAVAAIGLCAACLLLAPLTSLAQEAAPRPASPSYRPSLEPAAPGRPPAGAAELRLVPAPRPDTSLLPGRSVVERVEEPLPAPVGPLRVPLGGPPNAGQVDIRSKHGRVTLIVRDAPLEQVLSTLAEQEGLNVVFRSDAETRVSLTLTDVPVSDALTAVLSIVGYRWTLSQGILYVTRTSDMDQLPAHVCGRQAQVFRLDYVAAGDILEAVQGFLSPNGNAYKMESSSTDNRRTKETLVVEDVPEVLAQIQEYLAQIDQPPRQVLIEAHVLQVDLGDDLQHGVNLDQVLNLAGTPVELQVTGFANPTAPVAGFLRIDGRDMKGILQCLQTTTDAKTLASTRVLVVDGQEARIQVGSQLGFRVTTTTETSTLESVEFLDLGVVLHVTPRIGRDNRVIMRVRPEVSSGQVNPDTGLPEEETTEVETDILLASGDGMVIGGLIQETETDLVQKLPILGSIRGIGWLFQSRQRTKDRSEIIIALVPHVLPYDPCLQQRNAEEMMRVQTPILCGPLESFPRPWEPCLHQAQCRPRRLPPVMSFGKASSPDTCGDCGHDPYVVPCPQAAADAPAGQESDVDTPASPVSDTHARSGGYQTQRRLYDPVYRNDPSRQYERMNHITRLPAVAPEYRFTRMPDAGSFR
jgi:type IV pilus assembly protein PilQ